MRDSYWDNWKGIAIIAVVAIHASGGTAMFQEGSFNWLFGLTLRQFIDFAVPLFLAMSGYFSVNGSNGNVLSYYKGRFIRIIIPYLIWTAAYILIKTPTEAPSLGELASGIIFGTGIGIGYFVIVLSQLVILTPLYSKIQKPSHHIIIMAIASAIGTIFVYYFSVFNPHHLLSKFPAYALPFFAWYPFYHAGYFLARYKENLKIDSTFRKIAIFGFTVSLAFSLIEGSFWAYNENYSFGVSQLKLTSLSASLFLFFIAVSFKDKNTFLNRYTPISWLGANSYAIYLMHMLFLIAIQKLLKQSDNIYSFQPIYILLSAATAILTCAVVVFASQKTMPKSFSRNVLGN
ncbi:acyltransferase [Pseudomonas silesiensis]|uniref:acyltransferase n=1 Tax=Pseudomonas silesiensis TaxID=1853130 RepID=UPI0030D4EA5E